MADKENRRKCFKCGCSPSADYVKLFRFPKPGTRNLIRCENWARFIFPDKEPSLSLLHKLHSEHRMLCQRHFQDVNFIGESKQQLSRSAIPTLHDDECETNIAETEVTSFQKRTLGDVTSYPSTSATIPHSVEVYHTQSQVSSLQRSILADVTNYPSTSATITQSPEQGTSSKTQAQKASDNVSLAKCRKYLKKICELRNRIRSLKTKNKFTHINEDDAVKKLSKKITPTFAIILQGQLRNAKRQKPGRRWTREEKVTALRIYKRSPTCYRLLRRMFCLPAPGTLKTLLSNIPIEVGVNKPVLRVLQKYVKTLKPDQNAFILMFDEMALKKHLWYNTKKDLIEGYQDHPSQGRSSAIATQALVFMVSGIRQRVKQPVAFFFSSGYSTADRLAVLIKEVLQQCHDNGIHIAATVCDMDGVNRRALTILGASIQLPYIKIMGEEIITLYDTPHLLICFRNLLLKYDLQCNVDISSDDKLGRGIAKWSHIQEFFEVDNTNPVFVYVPSLTKDHLNPNTKQKMKVKLAAQVFSHSVAAGMYAKILEGTLASEAIITANLVDHMDRLFDLLNSDTPDLRRGKPYATNMKEGSPHLEFFFKMRKFFSCAKYIGSRCTPPSQDGWIWTINGVERLWNNLVRTHKIRSLATRRLQQDPLENLFGCIRGNCGSNSNPTVGQFEAALKTSIVSNLAYIRNKGNCEEDNNTIVDNFYRMQTSHNHSHQCQPSSFSAENSVSAEFSVLNELELDDAEAAADTAEIQACAYVCGFMLKKFASECDICQSVLFSKTIETYHRFVELREYSEFKKSLHYASKDMVICVERCAERTSNLLKEKGESLNLKNYVTSKVKSDIDFSFLNKCINHVEENINKITNSVFVICAKRHCIIKNRTFAEEATAAALRRKINILKNN